jgi:parallel beta-helix repeat protein
MTGIALLGIFDTPLDLVDRVSGSTTLYVNTSGSGGSYSTIQDAIDAANESDTIYVYAGVYFENVVVNKTVNLTGEHRDTTTIDGDGIGFVITVKTDWANITGITVTHGSRGIYLDSSDNCRIFNNNATSNTVTGIDLSNSDNNVISDNIILDNMYGIEIRSSDSNQLTNNYIAWSFRDGIKMSSSENNNFTANIMVENSILLEGPFIKYWNTHHIDTSNSINGKFVLYLKNQTGGSATTGAGQVILANCTQVTVENQELINGSIGIELGFSSNNTVANNYLFDNWYGIYLSRSHGNLISSNNASNNNRGIYIWNSDDNNVSGNVFIDNIDGIEIDFSSRNDIFNNSFSDNTLYGIYLTNSNWNTIAENLIWGNYKGIHLYESDRNNITRNTVSVNGQYSIYLSSSSTNRIYHNNFLNNENQAFDDSVIGNQWNDTYPSGGNYWADYDGVDHYGGPNQDVIGNDSIGDTPYVIDSDSRDNYPLMEPPIPIENETPPAQNGNITPGAIDVDYVISMPDIETMEGYFSMPANIDLFTQGLIKFIADTNNDENVSAEEADALLNELSEEDRARWSLRAEDLESVLQKSIGIDFSEPTQIEISDIEIGGLEGPVDSPVPLSVIIHFQATFDVSENYKHTVSIGINASYTGDIDFEFTIPSGWKIDRVEGLSGSNIDGRTVTGEPTGQVDIYIIEEGAEEALLICLGAAIIVIIIVIVIIVLLLKKKKSTSAQQPAAQAPVTPSPYQPPSQTPPATPPPPPQPTAQPPPTTPPPPPPAQAAPHVCPVCRGSMSFVQQYQRYYCNNCRQYQ